MRFILFSISFFCAWLSFGVCNAVSAQEISPPETSERVEISSYRGPELRSYSQMLKGLIAYQEKHSHAPNSELYFILIPKSKEVTRQGLTMRLASDDTSINIPIDAEGKFQLPLLTLKHDDEYDLILNKPKGQFYIKPYVKSANLPEDTKRMGDLRLECQVRWAVERQDVSMVFSSFVKLFASGNPCHGVIKVYFFPPDGVDLITLDAPKKKLSFEVSASRGYTVPLADKDISDDDLIHYARRLEVNAKADAKMTQ